MGKHNFYVKKMIIWQFFLQDFFCFCKFGKKNTSLQETHEKRNLYNL